MHICYLHINLWAEEPEAEFLLYIIALVPWSLKLEPCCWGTGVISTVVTEIHTYWNHAQQNYPYFGYQVK